MSLVWNFLVHEIWNRLAALSFATPSVAWLAVVAPVLCFAFHAYDHWRRGRLISRLGELPVISTVIASRSPGRRLFKTLLFALAMTLILLALARPQIQGRRKVELRGLDLAVAVDVSKSMLVEDVGPTAAITAAKRASSRLERARELAGYVIEALPGDRFAPIVFAGAATHFPLTEDREVAVRFLADLGPADLPQGSNLAEVLLVARCLLRPDVEQDACARIGRHLSGGDPLPGETDDDPLTADPSSAPDTDDEALTMKVERGRAILVFTDGGEPDGETIGQVLEARKLGIAVLFVGVGTEQGGVVHDVDPWTGKRSDEPKKHADGSVVRSKREDDGMRALAEAGGDPARYMIAAERGELDPTPIVAALKAVQRGLATKRVKDVKDVFEPFLFAGLMLLLIDLAISTRRRRDYPEAR